MQGIVEKEWKKQGGADLRRFRSVVLMVLLLFLCSQAAYAQQVSNPIWRASPHNLGAWSDFYTFGGSWSSSAVNWFVANQAIVYAPWQRHRLWWESEMRAVSGNINTYYSPTGYGYMSSNLPDYRFEAQSDEIGHQTRSPHLLVAGRWYSASVVMVPAAGQPPTFAVQLESALTDWARYPGYPWGEEDYEIKGVVTIPGSFSY